ncbi:hypothetical protein IT417_01820 [bacterium]|nr:hypothetical protein [bacterium]
MKNIWKYVLIAIPVLLLVASGTFYFIQMPTQEKQNQYAGLIGHGNAFLEQKEYAKSLNAFNEAASLLPARFEAYEGATKVLVAKNQLGQLATLLDNAGMNLSSEERSKLYAMLGNGYLAIQNPSQAQIYFEKAIDQSYQNDVAKVGLAKSLLMQGDYMRARNYLDIPTNSALYEEAYVLKLISKFSDLEGIKEVLAENLTPVDPNIKKIIDDYKNVAKRDAGEELYIKALIGRVYVNSGYSKMAVALLELSKDALMEYSDGLYVLSVAYFNLGDYDDVTTLLKDFSNPNADHDFYLLAARSYQYTGDNTEAIKSFDSAVASSGDKNEEVYKEYVKFLLSEEQYVKAKEVLDKADKKFDEVWIDTAYLQMYTLQKNISKASTYIEKLSKVSDMTDLEKKEYMYWAISHYIDQQKNNDAIIVLAKLKELDKQNAEYYLLAGRLHLQTANVTEAKIELEQAIDYDLTGEVVEEAKKLLSRVN